MHDSVGTGANRNATRSLRWQFPWRSCGVDGAHHSIRGWVGADAAEARGIAVVMRRRAAGALQTLGHANLGLKLFTQLSVLDFGRVALGFLSMG
jgi:hypothetical protein